MKRTVFSHFQKHRQLLPLLLLTALCISALVTVLRETVALERVTYGLALTSRHYAAFGAIILNFLTYFLFRKFYGYCLGMTILAGLFNLLIFPYKNSAVGIEISWLRLMIQPAALAAGLLACAVNIDRAKNLFYGRS